MPTLYVENVPPALYEALRKRAKSRRRSIAAEVLELLETNVPTDQELRVRAKVLRKFARMRAVKPRSRGPVVPAEVLQREDRQR
jgi:plasmid stability protein